MMKNTNRMKSTLAFVGAACLALAIIYGCGGGGGGDRAAVPGASTTAGNGAATLAVHVVDESGAPVPGVSVSVDGGAQTLATDAGGSFSVGVTAVADSGTPVRMALSRNCYVTEHEVVRVFPDSLTNGTMEYTVTLRREPSTADQATQAQITRAVGSTETVTPVVSRDPDTGLDMARTTVLISSNDRSVAFTTPTAGGAPSDVTFTIGDPRGLGDNASAVLGGTGSFTGSVTYGDPTEESGLKSFPGEFLTSSNTGSGAGGQGALITAGYVRISLKDASGNAVTEFASGTQASVTMRVPAGVQNPETGAFVAVGDTIPIFGFNEDTGAWVVESNSDGSVKRSTVQADADGMYVTFTTSHLSYFNLDWKSDRCADGAPKARIVDAQGNLVENATVFTSIPGWYNYPRLANDGVAQFYNAPADVDWIIWAEGGGKMSSKATISACKNNGTGLSEFDLVLDTRITSQCITNSDCDDNNAATTDECVSPGTSAAYCDNYEPACKADADCADSNETTVNVCLYPGSRYAQCYEVPCSTDAHCDDGNPATEDVCYYKGQYYAYCYSAIDHCDANADCADSIPYTIDECMYPDANYSYCSNCYPNCRSDADCTSGGACVNPGTCSAYCSCTTTCYYDTQCNDNNDSTEDICYLPHTCNSYCSNKPKQETDTASPRAFYIIPNNNGISWACSPSMTVYFDEMMDTSVDLNTQSVIDNSQFRIVIQNSNTGASQIIDKTNALAYGSFGWSTAAFSRATNNFVSGLSYSFKSQAELKAAGLKAYSEGQVYEVIQYTPPGNLKDVAGNPLDTTTGAPTAGRFGVAVCN